jgi:hypothetical protein
MLSVTLGASSKVLQALARQDDIETSWSSSVFHFTKTEDDVYGYKPPAVALA